MAARLRLFAISAAVLLAAWLPRLLPNSYSTDDYILLHGEPLSQSLHMYAAQGRFGMAALHLGLSSLGVSPIHAYTLLNLAAVLLLAAASVWLVRLWDVEEAGLVPYLIAPLAFAHPFAAETWSFRIGPVYFAAAMALALGGLFLIRRGRGRTLAGAALIVVSLSIYQVGLNPLLVAIGIGACLDLWRVGPDRAAARAVFKVWAITLGVVLAACLVYFALIKIALAVLAIPVESRAGFLLPSELGWRVKQVLRILPRLLGRDHQLGAPLLHALQLGVLALALGLATVRARTDGLGRLAATIALLFLSLLGVVGIHGALRSFSPAPRSLTALGIFWAGVVAVAYVLAADFGAPVSSAAKEPVAEWEGGWQAIRSIVRGPTSRLQRLAVGFALLIGFGYLGIDHRVASDQLRLNARELALASRILERLEANPKAAEVRRVVAIGHAPSYPDLETFGGDLNVSALFIPWSQAAIVSEVAGRPLGPATDEDRARGGRRCNLSPKWPADGAVAVDGELGIVCF